MPTTAKSHGDAITVRGHGRLDPIGPLKRGDLSFGQQLDAVPRWNAPITAPTSLPRTLSRGTLWGKAAVTRTPSCVREAATSQPMKLMPTTTACRIGHGLALDRVALRHRPKLVDPGQLGPRNVEPPVPPPGGDQDLLILDLLARVQHDVVRSGIHRDDARFEPLDVVLLIPVGGSDVPPVEILLRPEVGLGQRGRPKGTPGSRPMSTTRP